MGIKHEKKFLIAFVILLAGIALLAVFLFFKDKTTSQSANASYNSVPSSSEAGPTANKTTEPNKVNEFPLDMELLDSDGACIPELTHFYSHHYVYSDRIYTDADWEAIASSDPNLIPEKEYLYISSSNSSESIDCAFRIEYPDYISEDAWSESPLTNLEIYTVYKMADSNLYVGTIYQKNNELSLYEEEVDDSDGKIIGKIMLKFKGARLDDGLEISIGYFDDTKYESFYALNPGRYEYKSFVLEEELEYRALLGNQVNLDDYSNYSGTWYSAFSLKTNQRNYNRLELNIQPYGQVSGHLIQKFESENFTDFYGEADLYGYVSEGQIFLHYDEDGYGHSGDLILTTYENGIIGYLVEHGEPSATNGFNLGNTYFFRE